MFTGNFSFLGSVNLHKLNTSDYSDQNIFGLIWHTNINNISCESQNHKFFNNSTFHFSDRRLILIFNITCVLEILMHVGQ